MVPKAGRYYIHTFIMDIGVTQEETVSTTVFNIVVNAVVRVVLLEFCGPQEAHHGLVWAAGEHNIILY